MPSRAIDLSARWPYDAASMSINDRTDVEAGWRVDMSEMTKSAAGAVDTGHVPGRRVLRFQSIDEALAEANRLAEAERNGRLRRLGNWTLGQALNHLACWVEYSYTGTTLKVPFFIKWFLRLHKQKFLYGPMRSGARIPGVAGGTLATEPRSLEEGLAQMHRVMERLKVEAPTKPQLIFGQLSHQEWIALHLRHTELHLGFFVAD
jgi:hypothetical protein